VKEQDFPLVQVKRGDFEVKTKHVVFTSEEENNEDV
jgi:hypothetical protein